MPKLPNLPKLGLPRRRSATVDNGPIVPGDPASLGVALDPSLAAIRAGLAAHRRRLWLRRAVRRAWAVLAVVAVAELVLAVLQRLVPLEQAPLVAVALPVLGLLVLLALVVRARPSLGETALAVDAEGGSGDAVASALAFAGSMPSTAGPAAAGDDDTIAVGSSFDLHDAEARFVRRQRRDALSRLRVVDPGLFRPRLARRPALIALIATALVAPALLLPNPQDVVIAQQREIREEAERQAERIDEVAKSLEGKGADANDPRTQLAEELRQLAERLRTNPGDLDRNLAQLGAVEDDVRAQLDPANEQRAASLSSLSRSLSRSATGKPQANPGGDPKEARDDLEDLAQKVDDMTQAEREALARELAELQGAASQADGAAGQALKDAASSLAQGDTEGAKAALNKLGEALDAAGNRVQINRDLSTAASNLQDARRDLANSGGQQGQQGNQAGQQGQGQQGQGQPGGLARRLIRHGPGAGQRPARQLIRHGPGAGARVRGRGRARARGRGRARARVKARASRARGRVAARSAAVARTPGTWAPAPPAASQADPPTRTGPRSSARTWAPCSRPSIASASPATPRTSPAPAATARPSRATSRARDPTTAPTSPTSRSTATSTSTRSPPSTARTSRSP